MVLSVIDRFLRRSLSGRIGCFGRSRPLDKTNEYRRRFARSRRNSVIPQCVQHREVHEQDRAQPREPVPGRTHEERRSPDFVDVNQAERQPSTN
jgi:hypothetical protein